MRAGEVTFKTIPMSYTREPNWEKLKPTIDWDEQEEKLANKLENYINQKKQTVMNQGTVKSQKFVRTWNGPQGDIYYFDLIVESNGLNEVGQVGVKDMNSPKIAVGATIHYTTEERTGPTGKKTTNFKLQNPNPFNGGGNSAAPSGGSSYVPRKESPEVQKSISKSVALNNAVLFSNASKDRMKPGDVLDVAEIFLAWLSGEAVEAVQIKAVTNESADDEMPF